MGGHQSRERNECNECFNQQVVSNLPSKPSSVGGCSQTANAGPALVFVFEQLISTPVYCERNLPLNFTQGWHSEGEGVDWKLISCFAQSFVSNVQVEGILCMLTRVASNK